MSTLYAKGNTVLYTIFRPNNPAHNLIVDWFSIFNLLSYYNDYNRQTNIILYGLKWWYEKNKNRSIDFKYIQNMYNHKPMQFGKIFFDNNASFLAMNQIDNHNSNKYSGPYAVIDYIYNRVLQ